MKCLYLFLEIILYAISAVAFLIVFSRYRYRPAYERAIEAKPKTAKFILAVFIAIFFSMTFVIFIFWRMLGHDQPHHIGYFSSFFVSGLLTLAFFRYSLPRIDLALCLPSMAIVWALLLIFEAILMHHQAGWIYTDSTVLIIRIGGFFTIIFENLIVFYVFAPFMSILIFTGLAENRSDSTAFFLTILTLGIGGIVWEYLSIGIFHLWYMVEERSVLAFNLLNARTTLEEMFYYIPFASLSILIYLGLYYRKYHYIPRVKARSKKTAEVDKT
jgi:hypothetical protein